MNRPDEYARPVRLFVDPRVGSREEGKVRRSDIAALHHALRATPNRAGRTLAAFSTLFNLGEKGCLGSVLLACGYRQTEAPVRHRGAEVLLITTGALK